jgi:hypothetical protein
MINRHLSLLLASVATTFFTMKADAETLLNSRYSSPVDRYGHFALGRPHEYAQLEATTNAGRTLRFELPEDEVFEDLEPRLVKLAVGEPPQLLTIVSRRGVGARLALIRVTDGKLVFSAQSPAIGTAMRWLNPVAVVDLDGDGRAEISAVITPHIGGTLKIYRQRGSELVEVAALAGFSNHIYGSAALMLSTSVALDGKMHLIVPDTSRRYLRLITLQKDRLVEVGRCALTSAVTADVKLVSAKEVVVVTSSIPQRLDLDKCAK